MFIKNFIKKLIFKQYYNSDSFVEYLRKKGMLIGERTIIFNPKKTWIDETRPWLIEIGSDVQIPDNVTILTHGYDWSVLKGEYHQVLGSSGKVKIGNNVFIGTGTTILKGATIGNNVVIGANTLINKDIPDNVVVAGNPVRVICSLEDFYQRRKNAQLDEAKELVLTYNERFGKLPDKNLLSEFFWLFTSGEDELHPKWKEEMSRVGNFELSMEQLKRNDKPFEDYDTFLRWCLSE